ncbi:MAG: TIGR01777 family oxidoreductase [Bacteroidota bacterium]
MTTILITGGTGMIGTQLTKMLTEKGYEIIILTRNASEVKHSLPGVSYANWDIKKQTIDTDAIAKSDHIIHLAGAGVADKRWTEKRKQEIVNSRTHSSALIVKALKEIPNKIKTVVSASAIGWYGPDTTDSKQGGFTENAKADTAFLGETCRLWESGIEPVEQLNKRLVKLRTGIVLSNEGGALAEFKKPLKGFVAAILGDGKQVASWIHVEDLCRMYLSAIENEKINGVYNAVAPNPVTNKELVLTLAKQMRGNFFIAIHVPAFALKIALGEMSIEVLKSATVSSQKIRSAGFEFHYPTIETAFTDLIK